MSSAAPSAAPDPLRCGPAAAAVRRAWRVRALAAAAVVLSLLLAASVYWRDDILRTGLDPKQPYQTYVPPPAPDYAGRAAWALLPERPGEAGAQDPPADIFFVHPTTYDGGRDWNGPVDDAAARRLLEREMLPNYAETYARVGRLFAPRYRQASLYARLTLRDDARDARAFAFEDVRRAFDTYLARWGGERPIVIVGVEQGGELAARLALYAARLPRSGGRIAAVHLLQTAAPAADYGLGSSLRACDAADRVGCVLAFVAAQEGDRGAADRLLGKAMSWGEDRPLEPLGARPPLCVNPVTGSTAAPAAPESAARGAANATGLEPGARPPLMSGQVATRCEAGLLRHTAPRSPALKRSGGWAAGLRVPAFNLFYADLEADAARRVRAFADRRAQVERDRDSDRTQP